MDCIRRLWGCSAGHQQIAGQGDEARMLEKKEVAERLRYYREACVLSQRQVADALNIERSTYTKYETGVSEPNLTMIVKLAAIYNVSPTDLLPMDSVPPEEVQSLKDGLRADSPIYQLSRDERGLIALYRVLSKEEKQQAMELIGNLSKNADDATPADED